MRINKYIAHTGLCSRRKADDLIDSSKVLINGVLAEKNSVVAEGDIVMVNGHLCKLEKFVYLAFNKPKGYLSASSDERDQTIMDIVDVKERVFSLGRLDKDTEGLLILTNDGDLFNRVMHPNAKVEKVYKAKLRDKLSQAEISKIEKGMYVRQLDYTTAPCKVKVTMDDVYITICEGKKRQIRRIFEQLGNKVEYLQRVSVGRIMLGDLKVGKYRYLNDVEIKYLKSL